MTSSSPLSLPQEPGMGRSLLRAHAVFILGFAALLTAAVGILGHLQPATWTSTAGVVVQPQLLPNGGSPPAPDMGTEKAVATSGAVAEAAASALGTTAAEASRGVDISVPVDTHVLQFKAGSTTAQEAQRKAQAFSQAYVAYRSSLSTAEGRVVPQTSAVITPATAPTTSSRLPLQVGAALVVGLVLGTGLAALRDRWDRHVRGAAQLAELTHSPALALVPQPRVTGPARLVMTTHPGSATAEAYRFLRARLLGQLGQRGTQVLVLTCSDDRDSEARDVVAANLAAAAAEAGHSVVVVPGVPDSTLPSELLDGQPGGVSQAPARPADALASLGHAYDVVIVLAPPVARSAATLDLLAAGDRAVLVVDGDRSRRRAVAEAWRVASGTSEGHVWAVLAQPCSIRRAGLRASTAEQRPAGTGAMPVPASADGAQPEGLG